MHPFTSYPAAKHPKLNKFAITDMLEKPVDFFYCTTRGVDFNSHHNFANFGIFAKVSISVQSVIPWSYYEQSEVVFSWDFFCVYCIKT